MSGEQEEADAFLRELEEAGIGRDDAVDSLVRGLAPAPLPEGLRARIMASAAATGRFESFADQVAKLVDVTAAAAKKLLFGIDEGASWGESIVPQMQLYNFDGGPAVASAITGFVRMPPGSVFPEHVHVGQETVLVLQGGFVESGGDVVTAGQTKVSAAGSGHSFTVSEGHELIYLVVVESGVEIGGEVIGPEDPRL